jgi:hypothetical protein
MRKIPIFLLTLPFYYLLVGCINSPNLSIQDTPQPQPSVLTYTSTFTPASTGQSSPTLPAQQTNGTAVSILAAVSNPVLSPTPPDILVTISPDRTAPALDAWKSLPVLPVVSDHARSIYLQGLQMGRDPHAFSKVGDCQSITTYFLSELEIPGLTNLGPYASLQPTIDWFKGSFSRESLSVKGGFNAAAVLSPLRADPKACKTGENPVACEYRVHNPSIALISLEEWWAGHPENYEKYMRQIIDYSIQQGVLPILATKADNLEGNQLINQTIAHLAWEYDIPLWNFWAAVQPLPGHGLIEDGFHLTHGNNFNFSVGPALQTGWTIRNLTALQSLDIVRHAVASPAK